MNYKVFSTYDLKSLAYSQPFFSPNAGSAIRAFGDAVAKDPMLTAHPEDFQLFEVGEWDDKLGSLLPITPVKYLCCAMDFVQPGKPLPATTPVQMPKELLDTLNGGSR